MPLKQKGGNYAMVSTGGSCGRNDCRAVRLNCTLADHCPLVNENGSLNSPSNFARKTRLLLSRQRGSDKPIHRSRRCPYRASPSTRLDPHASLGRGSAVCRRPSQLFSGAINARVPDGVESGPSVPLVLSAGAVDSQQNVILAIQ